jgi:hypothetical protein
MAQVDKKASASRTSADLPSELEYLTAIDAAGFLPCLPLEDACVDAAGTTS